MKKDEKESSGLDTIIFSEVNLFATLLLSFLSLIIAYFS